MSDQELKNTASNRDSNIDNESSKSNNEVGINCNNKRNSTTPAEVSPSTSVRDKRSRKDKDEELCLDLCDKIIGEDETSLLHPFPFHGMNLLFRYKYQPNGIDPRYHEVDEDRKSRDIWKVVHCSSCNCEKPMCHDTRFGFYCGLRVAELIDRQGPETVRTEDVSKLLKTAYNEVLRVETVQQIGVLDTHNDYDPPDCILNKSMKNIMRHFLYEKFTVQMKKRLQKGSRGEYGTVSYGYYSALNLEVDSDDNGKE